MPKFYVLFDVKPTSSLYDFRFKSYGSIIGFHVFGDLDLWPMFYFFVTHTSISMRSFIRISQILMGDMPWTHTNTHTPKVKSSLSNPFGARLNMHTMCIESSMNMGNESELLLGQHQCCFAEKDYNKYRVHTRNPQKSSLTFPWHFPDITPKFPDKFCDTHHATMYVSIRLLEVKWNT